MKEWVYSSILKICISPFTAYFGKSSRMDPVSPQPPQHEKSSNYLSRMFLRTKKSTHMAFLGGDHVNVLYIYCIYWLKDLATYTKSVG